MSNDEQRQIDEFRMRQALDLARKGLGNVSPNPMVGCVIIDKDGEVIGRGYHKKFGEAHAEVNAVDSVKDTKKLKGATVYVTLEPCSHHGKTPPCSTMLSKLPIQRVVVAHKDPNEKVDGKGIAELRNKGIEVVTGVLAEEAEELNEAFIHHQQFGRPLVTLKIAQTADGYLSAPDGDSKWISGNAARTLVHKWRAESDAVLVGRTTAITDNPSLTVRHVKGRQPYRVVLDGPYELPNNLNLFSDKFEEKTIIITWNKEASKVDADPMLKLMKQNYFRGQVIQVPQIDGHINLHTAFRELGARGITSVLVEGGQQLSSALIREGLVDKLQLFIAPKLLGGGTRSMLNLGINKMRDIKNLKDITWKKVGDDLLLTGYL
ncbi:MAG TPA: bifunctional diaminohydroxyphosphoribosylaminopyrimidine deaminase/5-amino-6-(5-phosphoribosylamino)uracil reductase RibD [Balneolaceae bacterium]|nr:bifunctional diaminohydroxyphosphoribosylaminopyrimidine deaminase/5-amino-6-(5-phosphoribosylamino)uracil reductase RibD [Balneolaceae bacterium]|tara:strand:+ start:65424 stop:66554 length:1131 start_codon:yes stop_codon:yes gene_type:complete